MAREGEPVVVLVVEDEALLRLMAVDMIEDAGMVAVAAADASEAIALLEQRDDISIVFSDIEMRSGIDGLRLAAVIRDRWPPIGIVLTSGKLRGAELELPKGGVFLPKPYQGSTVVRTLRQFCH